MANGVTILLVYEHLRNLEQKKNTHLIHLLQAYLSQRRATRSTKRELFDYHIILRA